MPKAPTLNKDTRRVPPDVWKQMLAPVRAEIIEVMRALGTATIKEVASVLSRVPASLYAHVDRLVALGVLVEQEPRRLPRHTERVFALAARDFVPDFGGADAAAIGDIATRPGRRHDRARTTGSRRGGFKRRIRKVVSHGQCLDWSPWGDTPNGPTIAQSRRP
jgi:hypothetical protein